MSLEYLQRNQMSKAPQLFNMKEQRFFSKVLPDVLTHHSSLSASSREGNRFRLHLQSHSFCHYPKANDECLGLERSTGKWRSLMSVSAVSVLVLRLSTSGSVFTLSQPISRGSESRKTQKNQPLHALKTLTKHTSVHVVMKTTTSRTCRNSILYKSYIGLL